MWETYACIFTYLIMLNKLCFETQFLHNPLEVMIQRQTKVFKINFTLFGLYVCKRPNLK